MKLAKRILALLLVFCFIGLALVGCGGKKNEGDENNDGSENANGNTDATETETNEYGEPSFTGVVPVDDLDFEGEELTSDEITMGLKTGIASGDICPVYCGVQLTGDAIGLFADSIAEISGCKGASGQIY